MPRLNDRYFNTFEQWVDGDEDTEGNVLLHLKARSLRGEIDWMRQERLPILIARGCRVELIKGLYPKGWGYIIMEPDGQMWSLLTIARADPDYVPPGPKDEPIWREPFDRITKPRTDMEIHRPEPLLNRKRIKRTYNL